MYNCHVPCLAKLPVFQLKVVSFMQVKLFVELFGFFFHSLLVINSPTHSIPELRPSVCVTSVAPVGDDATTHFCAENRDGDGNG